MESRNIYVSALLKGWCIIALLLMFYMPTDGYFSEKTGKISQSLENSDYTTTFYTSGKLALERRLTDIYPESTSTKLAGTTYDALSHQALPHLNQWLVAICPYFPLTPLLFSPLSFLSPRLAFVAWQVLSLVALLVACWLIDRMRGKQGHSTFLLSMTFLPVVHCLFIGQSALLLGLLPLTVGFYVLEKNKPLPAGLIWSLCFLKPQFLLVPTFICATALLQKRFKLLVGLSAGTASLLALNALIFGVSSFGLWAQGMSVVDRVYSDQRNGVVMGILASAPRMFLLATPLPSQGIVKIIIAGIGLLLILTALAAVRVYGRRAKGNADYNNCALLLALSLVPLVSPYLFTYDLSVLILAWAAVDGDRSLKRLFFFSGVYINTYAVLVLQTVVAKLANPFLLLLIYLEIYRRLLRRAFRSESGEATGSDPPAKTSQQDSIEQET